MTSPLEDGMSFFDSESWTPEVIAGSIPLLVSGAYLNIKEFTLGGIVGVTGLVVYGALNGMQSAEASLDIISSSFDLTDMKSALTVGRTATGNLV